MVTIFYTVLTVLILAELTKSMSANGTPPILQKLSWQIDLARVMWGSIFYIRIILVAILALLFWLMSPAERASVIPLAPILLALWGFIYWFFNHHWVGRKKFHLLKNPVFKKAADSKVELSQPIMGVDLNGEQKAYPISMLFYHHQLEDILGNQQMWVTYCGLCMSGRVYDRRVDNQALNFTLMGAVNFNAVFFDHQTNSWWHQETGEAVKGKLKGKQLADLPMEQMSLEHWLKKHPNSEILQYDPNYQKKYNVRTKIMAYEASLPVWHFQKTPSMIIGVEVDGRSRAYDWKELYKRRMVTDSIGDKELLLLSSEDGASHFAYQRTIDGKTLAFEINGDTLTDTNTQSTWNIFGQCIAGALKGKELPKVQHYQQYIRAWLRFHPDSDFYKY